MYECCLFAKGSWLNIGVDEGCKKITSVIEEEGLQLHFEKLGLGCFCFLGLEISAD